jgi:hypothetical protein
MAYLVLLFLFRATNVKGSSDLLTYMLNTLSGDPESHVIYFEYPFPLSEATTLGHGQYANQFL